MYSILNEIINFVVEKANPYNIVKNYVKLCEDKLIIKDKEFSITGNIYILAIGKAACSMGKAIEDILGNRIKEGIAVTKYGYSQNLKVLRVIEAGHPYPDENSIKAGKIGLDIIKKANENDLIIFLISGGASSLFEVPEDDISFSDIREMYKLLVDSGLDIYKINTVRKHISKIKGGKILQFTQAKVISIIISDVVGNDLSTIASGLTYKDSTTFKDAIDVLKSKNIWEKVPSSIKKVLQLGMDKKYPETLKELSDNVYNFLIYDNVQLLEEIKQFLNSKGYSSKIVTTYMTGESREFGKFVSSIIKEIKRFNRPFSKPLILLFGGETYVTVTSETGKGGPNQEIILSMIHELKGYHDVFGLAMDTDGTDGPTDAAGAFFDDNILEKSKNYDLLKYLETNSSYNILDKIGCLIKTGPTYSNLNSLVIVGIL